MKTFSFKNMANEFDEHIFNSIRDYDSLCQDVKDISKYFIDDYTNVVDIGSSTGKMLNDIYLDMSVFKKNVSYYAIEIEKSFEKYYKNYENINFLNDDILNMEFDNCSFVYSLFTLVFIPLNKRKILIEKIYKWLNNKGCFVFSEKVDYFSELDFIMQNSIYNHKRKNFSLEEIFEKDNQLIHMMKKMSLEENIELCKNVGFSKVTTFWQSQKFVGILCIK